jgi:GntR family transcriptional regulator
MDQIDRLFSQQERRGLSQEGPTPLYFQLYTILRTAIRNGTLPNGAQMPTEQQLAEAFDVSRITAKRAMDELSAEGLVERRRGKGTHVTYTYQPKPVQAPLVGMLQEIESMARHSDARVLECSMMQPPAIVREALKLGDDESALYLVRVRSRNDQPFAYYQSWTRGITPPSEVNQLCHTPRLEVFRQQGVQITHVTQTISAAAATDELAHTLETEPGGPLLSLLRHSYDNSSGEEKMVDYMQVYYNPERFQYQMDLKLETSR